MIRHSCASHIFLLGGCRSSCAGTPVYLLPATFPRAAKRDRATHGIIDVFVQKPLFFVRFLPARGRRRSYSEFFSPRGMYPLAGARAHHCAAIRNLQMFPGRATFKYSLSFLSKNHIFLSENHGFLSENPCFLLDFSLHCEIQPAGPFFIRKPWFFVRFLPAR